MLTGRCCCGFVRYEVDAEPRDATLCHCSICQRTSGAPMVAWFTVPRSAFRVVHGELTTFRSSVKATRAFCSRCGTPLTFTPDREPASVDVTTSSLDDPTVAPPADHIYTSTMQPWVKLDDGLPRFRNGRGGEP